MNTAQRNVLTGSISVASILLTAAWAAAAGVSNGNSSPGPSGGGTHVSAPSGGGGAAPAARPSAPAPEAPRPSAPTPARSGGSGSYTPAPSTPNNGDDHRARWRHRDNQGNYTYFNPSFYSPYPYDGYINAGPDGYYNNYYGYSNDYNDNYGDNGPPVTEPNSNVNPAPPQPAPAPAPAQNGAVSAASAAAIAQNSADNNPQMIAANAAVQHAQAAFDAERRRVIDALQQQPDYQQALARRGAAQEQLNAAKQGDAVPDPAQLAPTAAAKMAAGDEVTRMRQQAIENDPAAKAAEQRLAEAVQRRDQLRAEILKRYQ